MIPKGPPRITVPDREVRIIQDKAAQRKAMREYMIKERSNPFKAAASNGFGFIEDPAFVRYEASQSFISEWTHFKPTMRSTGFFLGVVIAPMVAIGLYSEYKRKEFDDKCRRGEIAYRDRNNQFT